MVGEHRDGAVARADVLLVGRALLVADEGHLRRLVEVAKQPGDGRRLALSRATLLVRGGHGAQRVEVGETLLGIRPAAGDDATSSAASTPSRASAGDAPSSSTASASSRATTADGGAASCASPRSRAPRGAPPLPPSAR